MIMNIFKRKDDKQTSIFQTNADKSVTIDGAGYYHGDGTMMHLTIVNLTPHTLNVKYLNDDFLTIESSGIARCKQEDKVVDAIYDMFQITRSSFGEVSGIPSPQKQTIYIVSRMAAEAANRPDVLCPGPALRDEEGKIVGCNGFSAIAEWDHRLPFDFSKGGTNYGAS